MEFIEIPAGYKIDAMPKSIALMGMPDNSIDIQKDRRRAGRISSVVRFAIDYKKSLYFKENYPEFLTSSLKRCMKC